VSITLSKYFIFRYFTDGSKESKGHCGVGIYIPEFGKRYGYRVSDHLSVYSIEMAPIITALRWIKPLRSVKCTDYGSIAKFYNR